MNVEVHVDWQGGTHLAGRLYAAERTAAVSFESLRGQAHPRRRVPGGGPVAPSRAVPTAQSRDV